MDLLFIGVYRNGNGNGECLCYDADGSVIEYAVRAMTIIHGRKARNSATFFVILLEDLSNGLKKFELAEQDTTRYYYLQQQSLVYISTILSLTYHLREGKCSLP